MKLLHGLRVTQNVDQRKLCVRFFKIFEHPELFGITAPKTDRYGTVSFGESAEQPFGAVIQLVNDDTGRVDAKLSHFEPPEVQPKRWDP